MNHQLPLEIKVPEGESWAKLLCADGEEFCEVHTFERAELIMDLVNAYGHPEVPDLSSSEIIAMHGIDAEHALERVSQDRRIKDLVQTIQSMQRALIQYQKPYNRDSNEFNLLGYLRMELQAIKQFNNTDDVTIDVVKAEEGREA